MENNLDLSKSANGSECLYYTPGWKRGQGRKRRFHGLKAPLQQETKLLSITRDTYKFYLYSYVIHIYPLPARGCNSGRPESFHRRQGHQ